MHPSLFQLAPAAIALVVSGALFGLVLRVTSGRGWAGARLSIAAAVVRGIRAWARPADDQPGPISVAAVEPDDPAPGSTPIDPAAEVDEEPGPGRWAPPPAARVRGRIA